MPKTAEAERDAKPKGTGKKRGRKPGSKSTKEKKVPAKKAKADVPDTLEGKLDMIRKNHGAELHTIAVSGLRIRTDFERNLVKMRWTLGTEFNKVREKFKHGATRDLAEVWNLPSAMLGLFCLVAKRFTQKDMQAFMALKRANGRELEWGHFSTAARIVDLEQRQKLLQKCCDKNWDAGEFSDEVTAVGGDEEQGDGAPTQSITAFLRQLDRRAEALLTVSSAALVDLDDVIANTPPDRLTSDVLASFANVTDLFNKLETKTEEVRVRFATVCTQLLDLRALNAPTEVADGIETDDTTDAEPETTAAGNGELLPGEYIHPPRPARLPKGRVPQESGLRA